MQVRIGRSLNSIFWIWLRLLFGSQFILLFCWFLANVTIACSNFCLLAVASIRLGIAWHAVVCCCFHAPRSCLLMPRECLACSCCCCLLMPRKCLACSCLLLLAYASVMPGSCLLFLAYVSEMPASCLVLLAYASEMPASCLALLAYASEMPASCCNSCVLSAVDFRLVKKATNYTAYRLIPSLQSWNRSTTSHCFR